MNFNSSRISILQPISDLSPVIDTEVLIVGAGPAGSTTALALSKAGIPCVLVDQAIFPRDKVCGDALSGKVVQTLKRIDPLLADQLKSEPHFLASQGVTFIAPNGRSLAVPFRKSADLSDPPGFIARRIDFDSWLYTKAAAAPGVSTFLDTGITNYELNNGIWQVFNSSGEVTFKAKLIVVADGAQSRFVRNFLKKSPADDQNCAGLRVYYQGIKKLNQDGFIELHFLKEVLPGYFWIFPLPDGRANVGLGVRSDIVKRKKLNLKKELEKIITTNPLIAPRFKDAIAEGPVSGYGLPLGSVKRSLSGDGYLLLGDAGSLIDPFTGEGIGNAMISALKAAEVIAANYALKKFSAADLYNYDKAVYKRLWTELQLSTKMQELVKYPWLFNLVINKALKSHTLRDTISCMFEDIDLRSRLKNPAFYWKVLFE